MGDFKIEVDTTEPNTTNIFIAITVTILLTAIIFIWAYYYYTSTLSQQLNKLQDTAERHPYITTIEEKAKKSLSTLKYIDKEKNKLQIPIEMAIENVIKDYNPN